MAIENIAQAHPAIKVEIDKSGSLETLNMEPEEIDYFLNKAMTRWFQNRYSGINPKKESVEQTQKRIDDLRVFIPDEVRLSVASATGDGAKANSYEATFPSNYVHALGEEVEIAYTDCDGNAATKRQGIIEITSDTYQYESKNPYSDYRLYLYEAKPMRLINGTTIQLITDGNYTLNYYYLRYIRLPAKLSYYTTRVTSGNIVAGVYYKVLDGVVGYGDGGTYTAGTNTDTFLGTSSDDTFSIDSGRGIVASYVDFEIPVIARDEIITEATKLILVNLGNPNIQLQAQELVDME